jgi:hypothetical protein
MSNFRPDYSSTIRAGRAFVRLIEATAVLIEWDEDERSQRKWLRLRREAQERLRRLVEVLPPHITAEIMVASEKMLGTVQDVSKN